MIQIDEISKVSSALCVCLSIYLYTIDRTFLTIFPCLLIISAIVMQWRFGLTETDETIDETEFSNLILYGSLAVMGAFLSASVTSKLLANQLLSFNLGHRILYGINAAIAEEEFFRGFLTNLLLKWSDGAAGLSIVASSAAFMAYHFSVYGMQPTSTLLYVMSSGLSLGASAWKTDRLSTNILAHAFVNMIAFGVS